jgi:hypothetical protein
MKSHTLAHKGCCNAGQPHILHDGEGLGSASLHTHTHTHSYQLSATRLLTEASRGCIKHRRHQKTPGEAVRPRPVTPRCTKWPRLLRAHAGAAGSQWAEPSLKRGRQPGRLCSNAGRLPLGFSQPCK